MTIRRSLDPDEVLRAHPGVSEGGAASWVEAAAVALSRHHEPPSTRLAVVDRESADGIELLWDAPSDRARRFWADPPRTTEWGAEALAAITVEARRKLVVVHRAERGSRVDYYLGEPGADLEHAVLLEVSGTDGGSLRSLMRSKVEQARRNADRLPALAAAVRFDAPEVMLEDVENDEVLRG